MFVRTGATFNKGDSTTQQKNNYIRVLRGGNISYYSTVFRNDDIFIPSEIVNENIIAKQYDIITPAVTSLENIGKMSCLDFTLEETLTVGGFVYLLSPIFRDYIFAKFIVYQLTSAYFINLLKGIAKKSGAAFYNINKTKFSALPFFIPPYKEQKRIVACIEQLFSHLDIVDENQTEIERLYDDLKNKTLDLAIRGKLVPQDPNDEPASVLLEKIRTQKKVQLGKKYVDSYIYKGDDNCYYEHIDRRTKDEVIDVPFDLPDNWAWSKLKEVAFTQTGTTPSTTNINNFGTYIPFIKPGDILDGAINYYNEGLSQSGLSSGRLIKQNSILMVCIGGSLGKCALCDRDVSCNQQINTATPEKFIDSKYLFYCLSSDYFYRAAKEKATGTATPIINRSLWENIFIPLPPFPEQKRIVDKLNEIFAEL